MFPMTLLSRLYEQHSLRNTEDGFTLSFRNRLAPSTVVAVGPLIVGDRTFETSQLTLFLERPVMRRHGPAPNPLVRAASEVSRAKSLPFALDAVAHVFVAGTRLRPGRYQVSLALRTSEIGDITIQANDQVGEDLA